MTALAQIDEAIALPVSDAEFDCPMYDEVSEQEVTLKCGFTLRGEQVSDDALYGGKYYTEYTARLVSARVGRLVVNRDTFLAMMGRECLKDAETLAGVEAELLHA